MSISSISSANSRSQLERDQRALVTDTRSGANPAQIIADRAAVAKDQRPVPQVRAGAVAPPPPAYPTRMGNHLDVTA